MPGVGTDALKFVHSGLIGPDQSWSVSTWCSVLLAGGSWGPSQLNFVAEAVGGFFETYLNAVKNNWTPQTSYRETRAYFYADGSDSSSIIGSWTPSTPVVGASSDSPSPVTTSMVMSLRSDVPGRSGRGRFYIPYTDGGIIASGHFAEGNIDTVGAACVTYLEAINNADWSGESVASQAVVVASFSKTTTHAITHVVVDDIPDNQSRRKDKLGSITSYAGAVT